MTKVLQRVKTPNTKPKDRSESGSEDRCVLFFRCSFFPHHSLETFVLKNMSYLFNCKASKTSLWKTTHQAMTFLTQNHPLKVTFISVFTLYLIRKQNCICGCLMFYTHCFTVPTKSNTPASQHLRRPLSHCDSPVFVSDSDDDNIVIKSTWRTRSSKRPPKANVNGAVLCDKEESLPSVPLSSPFSLPRKTSLVTPQRTLSAPSRMDDTASSEEEFTSLLERLKLKNKLASTTFSPQNTQSNNFIWILL